MQDTKASWTCGRGCPNLYSGPDCTRTYLGLGLNAGGVTLMNPPSQRNCLYPCRGWNTHFNRSVQITFHWRGGSILLQWTGTLAGQVFIGPRRLMTKNWWDSWGTTARHTVGPAMEISLKSKYWNAHKFHNFHDFEFQFFYKHHFFVRRKRIYLIRKYVVGGWV